MLRAEHITAGYRGVIAVREVSIEVPRGSLVGLVGSNGAGKTTLLRTLAGMHVPTSGRIVWDGDDITGRGVGAFLRAGIVSVQEGRRFFPELTVAQNLRLGAWTRPRAELAASLARCYELFGVLGQKESHLGGSLSGGEQQMLCIAQALMARPAALVVDEPSVGLAPLLVETLLLRLQTFAREENLAVIVAEQAVGELMRIADHVTVLERSRVVLAGTPEDIKNRPEVRAAYLGA